jgi:hypothetical protein
MRRMKTLLCALTLAVALAPEVAGACAALFSPEAEVRQSGQRIIFAVDRAAGMVEAYVAVRYVGEAEGFAWIVPMPSNPKVEVTSADAFDALDRATRPRILLPTNTCPEFSLGAGAGAPEGGAPGSGVDIYQQGQVGPYDFSVVGGADGGQLTDWLRQNGYRVTQPMEPLIQSYADAGMLFLAMKLQGGREAGDIEPVKMTFQAEKAMIPLRLAAVGAEPGTELRVWVFADGQVAPENMERLTIPDEKIGVTSFRGGGNNYYSVLDETVASAAGRGLVTEAAQLSSGLADVSDPLISELRGRFPYITRFYGRFDPEQMTVDPVFATQPDLADIPIERDLRGRVSPYSCGSREVLALEQQPTPAGSAGGIWLAYGWILPCCILPLLVVGGLGYGVRALFRRSRGKAAE